MTTKRLKVCIIGAGASGLVSIKNCVDDNLEPVCYEKSADIGGLWNYRTDNGKNQATVMESTVVNSCKEMYAFSDFPPPTEWPNFTHHSLVQKYLRMYTDHFDLLKYIHFNTSVQKVIKAEDYDITGRWVVHLTNGSRETFDAVMLCTGHHAEIHEPYLKDIEKFKGRVMHSQKYRTWREFKNQRVLIVGVGNSALDISVELSDFCPKVYLSTRRGVWIWPRVWKKGIPNDAWYLSRWRELVFTKLLPMYYINGQFEHTLNKRMDAVRFGIKPKHRFWSQHPAVNDRIHTCLNNGSVIMKHDVERFTETSAIFVDGSEVEIDTVILCTGYIFGFPFLEPDIIPVNDNQVSLYKFVYPPNLPHPTLAVIGLIQPHGPLFPLSELQGRWVTSLLTKKCTLPCRAVMERDIDKKNRWLQKRYFRSPKHTLQVMCVPYADELAALIGAKPKIFEFLFTDPKLALVSYFGPYTPYNFRLNDPKTRQFARENVLGSYSRILAPTQTRRAEPGVRHKWLAVVYKLLLAMLLAFLYTFIFTKSGLRNYLTHSSNLFYITIFYLGFALSYYLISCFLHLLCDIYTDFRPLVT